LKKTIIVALKKREMIRMEQVRKKDARHLKDPKHPEASDASRMKIWDSQSTTPGVSPGIPATAWLGVERMKLLLDLKKVDLIVSK